MVSVYSLKDDAGRHYWEAIHTLFHWCIVDVVTSYDETCDVILPHIIRLVGVDDTFYYTVSAWDGRGFPNNATPVLEVSFPEINYAIQNDSLFLLSSRNLLRMKNDSPTHYTQWRCRWLRTPPDTCYSELLITRQTGLKYELVSLNSEGDIAYSPLKDTSKLIPSEYCNILVGVATHWYLKRTVRRGGGERGYSFNPLFIISTTKHQILILDNGSVKTFISTSPCSCTNIKTMQVFQMLLIWCSTYCVYLLTCYLLPPSLLPSFPPSLPLFLPPSLPPLSLSLSRLLMVS